jgi:hypothetical protein
MTGDHAIVKPRGDAGQRLFDEKPVCYKYRQSSKMHERIE